MGKLILFTGGARSGKSNAAQAYALERFAEVSYIATAVITDAEMKRRVKKHQEDRPASWHTYEAPTGIVEKIEHLDNKAYLIDCITVYVTNLIFEKKQEWDEDEILTGAEQQEMEDYIVKEIVRLLDCIDKKDATFVLVSNEVGMGIVPANSLGRLFRDVAGRVNQIIAKQADEVWLTVSGIPLKIKG